MLFNMFGGAEFSAAGARLECASIRDEINKRHRRLLDKPFLLRGAMPLLEISGSNLGTCPSKLVGLFASASKELTGMQIYIAIEHHRQENGAKISVIDPLTLDTLLTGALHVSTGAAGGSQAHRRIRLPGQQSRQ